MAQFNSILYFITLGGYLFSFIILYYSNDGAYAWKLTEEEAQICSLEYTFGFSEVYFSIYLLCILGIFGSVVFFVIKSWWEVRKNTQLNLKIAGILEGVYMDPKKLKAFYQEHGTFLRNQPLFEGEMIVFKDQFSNELRYSPRPDYTDCAVCTLTAEITEIVVHYPKCHHNYHFECLKLWIKDRKSCPTCRGEFRENFAEELNQKMETSFLKEGPL